MVKKKIPMITDSHSHINTHDMFSHVCIPVVSKLCVSDAGKEFDPLEFKLSVIHNQST